jgi:zona occludens toxin (predicted ATPase)
LNSGTNTTAAELVASLAQNSTVPVALTPKVGLVLAALALAPADIAEIPVMDSTVTVAATATMGLQYFFRMTNPPVVETTNRLP